MKVKRILYNAKEKYGKNEMHQLSDTGGGKKSLDYVVLAR